MNVEELDIFIEEIKIDELRKNEDQTTNDQPTKSTGAVRKIPGSIGPNATKDYMPNNLQKTVDLINKNYRVVVILRYVDRQFLNDWIINIDYFSEDFLEVEKVS